MKLFKIEIFFIVFLLIMIPVILESNHREFLIQQISVESGISDKTITSIIQDKEGYMWFGTESGLNRYDGYSFKIFKNDPENQASISYNRISCLAMETDGTLWVGTSGGGINCYQRNTGDFKRYSMIPGDLDTKANIVLSIFVDRRGEIWVGTWGEGLFKFNKADNEFENYKPFPGGKINFRNRIQKIYEDSSGSLWVGTRDGLFKFNKEQKLFVRFSGESDIKLSVNKNAICTIFEDRYGDLWAGTYDGVFIVDHKSRTLRSPDFPWIEELKNTRVFSIAEDSYGRLWIGSWEGLYSIKKDRINYNKYTGTGHHGIDLSSSLVLQLYIDRSNIFWVGTMNGLNVFNGNRTGFKNYDMRDILSCEKLTYLFISVYENHDGKLWLGTVKHGILILDRESGSIEKLDDLIKGNVSLKRNAILNIQGSGGRFIYIGTSKGLSILDQEDMSIKSFVNDPDDPESICNNYVVSCLEYEPGKFFVGTMEGLDRFDLKSEKFVHYFNNPEDNTSISADLITSVMKDNKGRIWIGTYGGGLNTYDPVKDNFIRLHDVSEKNPRKKFLYPIIESGDGMLWMGSNEGGLKMFDPDTEKFKTYYRKDGLPSDTVWDVFEDKSGNIWFSTTNGVSRLNRADGSIANFNKFDGLLIDFFTFNSGAVNKKGEMFFTGNNGIVSFNPEMVRKFSNIPQIVITSIRKIKYENIVTIPVKSEERLVFDHNEKMVTFDFSAMSFLNSKKNRYKYRLSGLSEQWVDIGNRHSISFGSLSPGKYMLTVIGSNCFGDWNDQGASVHFVITPPYWQTWWFKVLLFLLSAAVFVFFHLSRLKKLEKKLRNESEMEKLFRRKGISKREREITFLIIRGMTSREIEDKLFISYGTIKNHIYSIYKKLNVKNRAEIVNLFKEIKNL